MNLASMKSLDEQDPPREIGYWADDIRLECYGDGVFQATSERQWLEHIAMRSLGRQPTAFELEVERMNGNCDPHSTEAECRQPKAWPFPTGKDCAGQAPVA